MEAAELIRKLIDVLSQINQPEQPQQPNHAHLTIVANPEPQSDFPERDHTSDETGGVMVPPLQQKLELLKKVAGEESIFNQPGDEDVEGPEDELSIIKRNAGIHPIVTHMASEDTDIES
jgi:hypothetical protein